MRKWLLICGAGAVVGYGAVYFALDLSKPNPGPQPHPRAAAPAPAEPVVLATVVDVTSLDPLLEPRAGEEPTGAPFDAPELPSELAAPTRAVAPMPHAVD